MLNFPDSPTTNQVFSAPTGAAYKWDGTKWGSASSPGGNLSHVTISDTAPTSPLIGDLWWNSSDSLLYIWYNDGTGPPGQWVNANNLGASGLSFAPPTASVGTGPVNGIATTLMRSDAAPALSQAITPTWTGLHTFNLGLNSGGIVDSSATVRATGGGAPAGGAGVELSYVSNQGFVNSYDRTGSAYKPLVINASQTTIGSPVSISNLLDVSGTIRATAQTVPSGGAGMELVYTGGSGYISTQDRGGGNVWKPLNLQASQVLVPNSGLSVTGGIFSARSNLGATDWLLKFQNNRGAAGDLGCWYPLGAPLNTADGASVYFQWMDGVPSAGVGAIARTGTNSVVYSTTSNAELKTIVNADSPRGLDVLRAVPVRDYSWNGDEEQNVYQGLFAQELQKQYPEAVSSFPQRDGDGQLTGETYWGIDYGRLTPLLMRAIQQLADKVDELTARLEAKS